MQPRLFFLVCLCACVNCFSQQYPFVHYTPREGLVNNRTKFIFQDSKGKLYISTYGGLSIYDGSQFVNYSVSNGLALNLVNDIVEMGEDSIWIITNTNKIQCLVRGILKDFIPADNYTPLINHLVKCSDGYYYAVADEGLFRLQNKRFIRINLQTNKPIETLTQAIEVDRKLYILSNPHYKLPASNLVVYDLEKKKLVAFDTTIHASHLFYSFKNGIWISTVSGLHLMNKISQPNDSISLQSINSIFHLPNGLYTYFIFQDRQSNKWVASNKGVYCVNPNGVITTFTVENGLTTNFQTSVFQDYENNIWFTNELTGLTKLSNLQLAFYKELKSGFDVSDISITPSSDSVWMHDVNHHQVILLLPDGTAKLYSGPGDKITFPANLVFGNTNKWILNGSSVYQWKSKPGSRQYSLLLVYKDSKNSFGFASIDRKGNLLTVSDKLVVIAGRKVLSESVNYLADQLAIDTLNRVWIATRSNSLFCFQVSGSADSTTLKLLKSFSQTIVGSPRSIVADQKGNIWIGTRDQGLYCLHFDNMVLKSVRELTIQNGLSENFVTYLYCDKNNNIWACTPSGLDEIRTDTNGHFLIENITGRSNLYFPVFKVQQTKQGVFWILTAAGIIRYDPAPRSVNNWKPALSFSSVSINNIIGAAMPGMQFKYFENNIVFHLSAPSFIDEKQTRFSYFLEGSGNDNWSLPTNNASLNFANLPPGQYTLHAKAIFLNGLYPDAERSYAFSILPPWWQLLGSG